MSANLSPFGLGGPPIRRTHASAREPLIEDPAGRGPAGPAFGAIDAYLGSRGLAGGFAVPRTLPGGRIAGEDHPTAGQQQRAGGALVSAYDRWAWG
jgi:hypothetical protein